MEISAVAEISNYLLSPSKLAKCILHFALRASLRLSKFAPGEFVTRSAQMSGIPSRASRPEILPANLRDRLFRGFNKDRPAEFRPVL